MPTQEFWAEDNILTTAWQHPVSAEELATCFNHLATMIGAKPAAVKVLFDLRQARYIPAKAPLLAIQSGFLSQANTESVAVISTDVIAEILANVASRVTHHTIYFFADEERALAYLKSAKPNGHDPASSEG